jgi:hypothetical protein
MTSKSRDEIRDLVRAIAVTLGSSVRALGIFLDVRGRLPQAGRKSLTMKARELILRMPADSHNQFRAIANVVSNAFDRIESRPIVIRARLKTFLGITSIERRRWLIDGRLPSAGTLTKNLRGRAREITFPVFARHVVEDILDRGLVDAWREGDAAAACRKAA